MNEDSRRFHEALVPGDDDPLEAIYLGMVSHVPGRDGDGPWTQYHFTQVLPGGALRSRVIGMGGEPKVACVYRALVELEASHGIRHNVSDAAILAVVRRDKTPRELLLEQT